MHADHGPQSTRPRDTRSGRGQRSLLLLTLAATLALASAAFGVTPALAASGGGCSGKANFSGGYSNVRIASCISSPYGFLAAADAYIDFSHNYNHPFSSCTVNQRIYNNFGSLIAGPVTNNCVTAANNQNQNVHYYGAGKFAGSGDRWHNYSCVFWTDSGYSSSGCVNSPQIRF